MKDRKKEIEETIKCMGMKLEQARRDITDVEVAIEKLNGELKKLYAKPMVKGKSGKECEIAKYIIYTDRYIEFETASGTKYRFFTTTENGDIYKYPNHRFEEWVPCRSCWVGCSWIDHIELLEGVDEYDKTREL